MAVENHFASNLRYLRKQRNMEQLELARKLGKRHSSTISGWEKGDYTPTLNTLVEIANVFGVDLNTLVNYNWKE